MHLLRQRVDLRLNQGRICGRKTALDGGGAVPVMGEVQMPIPSRVA